MFKCAIIAQLFRNLIFYGVITLHYIPSATLIELDEYGRTPLSKNITAILDRLVNKATYDKRLRPNYGGEPVEVGITIFVSSISAVSEVEMDYTLDIYLRQMWSDSRLAFNTSIDSITIDIEYMKSIWIPDTFFPNEKKSLAHTATTHNSFLRITALGNVTTSQRLTVTAACAMDLLLFPLDSQECTLEIESYGYSSADIRYVWWKGQDSVTKEAVNLPQFLVKEHKIAIKESVLSTGVYSRLICRFLFLRSIGFYMIQIYLPSSLIVIISWVSFWLSRDATPARVALGVTTVLTMTTLMTTTNAAMPKVSYIKSIDVYLGTCFLMVFASLLEYAAVGYLNKRLKMHREGEARQRDPIGQQSAAPRTPMPSSPEVETQLGGSSRPYHQISIDKATTVVRRHPLMAPVNTVTPLRSDYGTMKSATPARPYGIFSSKPCGVFDNEYRPPAYLTYSQYRQVQSPLTPISEMSPLTGLRRRRPSECDCEFKSASTTLHKIGKSSGHVIPPTAIKLIPVAVEKKQKSDAARRRRVVSSNPSSIDKYSRVIFPLAFATFNAVYWLVYIHISQKEL